MNTHGETELMAPAGSWEALTAACNAGAGSVYFGIEHLNMRSRSSANFTLADMPELVSQCRAKGVKAYLTLNTIMYDNDIRLMKKIADAALESGIAAIIASDHAAIAYCASRNIPVHISTQANITNTETVKFYSAWADAMVLSRELSLTQLAHIVNEIKRRRIKGPSGRPVRIEVFAHGALCMAVSGKCYLSLHTNYASANRGVCVQNCRRSYIVTDKETGSELEVENENIMSAKDLCTISFLDKLVEAGIAILKIEGRGRSADYVHTVTSCYREALDACKRNEYTAGKVEDWEKRLSTVFNRGFWDGYYLGRTMGEWHKEYGSKATQKKIFLGTAVKYYPAIGVAHFKLENAGMKQGETLLITGKHTGVLDMKADGIWVDGVSYSEAGKGQEVTFCVKKQVREGDKLYKLISA
ncbi:MAG: U32 family peptidase [Bacteroidia bacterium]|nr:U32 family peptidase [Bacteroidia bacterium]